MADGSPLFLFASSVVWKAWLVVPVQVGSLGYRFHCFPPTPDDDPITHARLFASPSDAVLAGINVLIEQKGLTWSEIERPRFSALPTPATPEHSPSEAISA